MIQSVIDVGCGDSGKGLVTAYLCSISNNPLVVRFSGGHQAGHTVIHNGIRHVFSSFGSGTMQGVPTYWSKNCTFYPIAFLNELYELKEKGITPKIYVNGKCPVTTFFDVEYNKKINDENQHGSCGVGFGATLEREEKYYSLLVEDLQFPSIVKQKLTMIHDYYANSIDWTIDDYNYFIDCIKVLDHIVIVNDISDIDKSSYEYHRSIIYEGSQGLGLDKNIGFFPHVTRSNVGSKAISAHGGSIYYVTRAYQTRHGNGPMTNEGIEHNISKNPNETNVTNYQGEFRRTLLDLDLLEYSIYKDITDSTALFRSLVITCLDHIENDYRFTYKGNIHHFLNEDEFIKNIYDILKPLNISQIYLSRSDDYTKIERWNNDI